MYIPSSIVVLLVLKFLFYNLRKSIFMILFPYVEFVFHDAENHYHSAHRWGAKSVESHNLLHFQ